METAGRHRDDAAAAAAAEEEEREGGGGGGGGAEQRRAEERRGRGEKAAPRRLLKINSSPMSDSVDVFPSRLERRKPAQVTLSTSIQPHADKEDRKAPPITERSHFTQTRLHSLLVTV